MARMAKGRVRSRDAVAIDLIMKMEPELRFLEGLLVTLRSLGEARDQLEPIALAALSRCGDQAIQELWGSWQDLLEVTAEDRPARL